jgi:hypothetical protein
MLFADLLRSATVCRSNFLSLAVFTNALVMAASILIRISDPLLQVRRRQLSLFDYHRLSMCREILRRVSA